MQSQKTAEVQKNLKDVKHTVVIASGKGGVGKSTVSVAMAKIFAARGYAVGILDADIHGPNIPVLLGAEEQVFQTKDDRVIPISVNENICLASVASMGYDKDTALIWRGPMKLSMIRQFLELVEWGALDVLIIDTPPGTGDEVLTIGEYLPTLSAWVVVTTPQSMSLIDARRSINFAKKLHLPIAGIIENMCDSNTIKLFGAGGGKSIAEEFDVPFLGSIPVMSEIVQYTEQNRLLDAEFPQSIDAITDKLVQHFVQTG